MKSILEIVNFKVKDGVSTEAFLKASADMEKSFVSKQVGFIKRTLGKGEDSKWVDVVYWETMENATKVAEATMESPVCAPMFGMIDEVSIKMSHFEIQN